MKLYLISAKAGVGKDTVAEIIEQNINKCNIYKFATGVKMAAEMFFGWNEEKDSKGRKLLQQIGFIGREYNQDVWVKQVHFSIQDYLEFLDLDAAVVSDWRFPSEAEYLKNTGVYDIVKVRIEAPERESLKGTEAYNDVSETSLPTAEEFPDYYDYIIYNTGTKAELKNKVLAMLEMEK